MKKSTAEARSLKQMLVAITAQLTSEVPPRGGRLMITSNFNLRGMAAKQSEIEDTPLCTGWMAFVNRSCTLAHVMPADAIDDYVRLKLVGMKGSSEEYIRKHIYGRMRHRYIF